MFLEQYLGVYTRLETVHKRVKKFRELLSMREEEEVEVEEEEEKQTQNPVSSYLHQGRRSHLYQEIASQEGEPGTKNK